MKYRAIILSAFCASAILAQAATYTWTGALDGDWTNIGNWDGSGVPVDTNPGGNLELDGLDRIVIDASGSSNPIPTLNLPGLGGNPFSNSTQSTPQIDLLFGTMTFSASGFGGQGLVKDPGTTWITNIGDGNVGNGAASLTLNGGFTSGVMRDPNGNMQFVVNADGALTLNASSTNLVTSYGTGRNMIVTLNGGGFVSEDPMDMLRNSIALGGSYFDLTLAGSSVTADFGADFADLTAVNNATGSGLTFRSSTALTLGAVDNGNGTFTVQVVPEPSSLALLSLGGLGLMLRRRRH